MAQVSPSAVIGRYRVPVVQRWLTTALAAAYCAIALGQRPFTPGLAVAWVLLAAASWLLPTTVIHEDGVYRPFGLPGRRRIGWDHIQNAEVGRGTRSGGVYLRMREGRLVGLKGVPPDRIVAMHSLAARHRTP